MPAQSAHGRMPVNVPSRTADAGGEVESPPVPAQPARATTRTRTATTGMAAPPLSSCDQFLQTTRAMKLDLSPTSMGRPPGPSTRRTAVTLFYRAEQAGRRSGTKVQLPAQAPAAFNGLQDEAARGVDLKAAAALCGLVLAFAAAAQEPGHDAAPVEIDGEALFRLRGVQALPGATRAAQVVEEIEALARDRKFNPDQLRAVEREYATDIVAGTRVVLRVTDGDAELEAAKRPNPALAYIERIQRAIAEYREARTRASLLAATGRSAAALGLAAALTFLTLWLFRRAEGALQASLQRRIQALATESRRILRIQEMLRGRSEERRVGKEEKCEWAQ